MEMDPDPKCTLDSIRTRIGLTMLFCRCLRLMAVASRRIRDRPASDFVCVRTCEPTNNNNNDDE